MDIYLEGLLSPTQQSIRVPTLIPKAAINPFFKELPIFNNQQ